MSDAEKQFEALERSGARLRELRLQLRHAEEEHAQSLQRVLDAAATDPSQWQFEVVENGQTSGHHSLTREVQVMIGALRPSGPRPDGGAGCPERTGCANIGQFGNRCFYICRTATGHHQ